MVKLALLVPVIFVLGAPAATVTVDGVEPVSIGKTKAYPSMCSAPLKVSAAGPATLVVDVRGKDVAKAVELDLTRNEKSVSKNALVLKKSKTAGKGFAGMGQLVITVPEGQQQYTIACDATAGIAMSFKLSKKPVKGNSALAEVAVEPPKVVEKVADAKEAPKEAPKETPDPKATGGGTTTFIGVFTHTTTVMNPSMF